MPFSNAFSRIYPITWFNQAFSSQPHSTGLVLRIPSALHFDKSSTVSCSQLSAAFVSVDHSFLKYIFCLASVKPTLLARFLTHLSVFSSLLNLFLIVILPSYRWKVTGLWAQLSLFTFTPLGCRMFSYINVVSTLESIFLITKVFFSKILNISLINCEYASKCHLIH